MALQYVARKPLKVAGRTVQPGEVVPEAAAWRNVQAYVNNGSLAVALEVPEGAVENAELTGQVAALAERLAALERLVAGAGEQDGAVEVLDEPDSGESADGENGDTEPTGGTPGGDDAGTTAGDAGAARERTAFLDAGELEKLNRDQLDELAADMGVKSPGNYPNKKALIADLVTIPVSAPADPDADETQP